jgi:hypothetical protein
MQTMALNFDLKQAIGRAVAKEVKSGNTILLGQPAKRRIPMREAPKKGLPDLP